MKAFGTHLYTLLLALWVGGIFIFTFIVTPAIFRSYGRDVAGDIVGKLFPGYFSFTLVISLLSLLVLGLSFAGNTGPGFRASLILILIAVLLNAFVLFRLHPDMRGIKQEISSFENRAPDDPLRRRFGRLHALSSICNLIILTDGVILLVLSRGLRN